jgi:hypothetical protein
MDFYISAQISKARSPHTKRSRIPSNVLRAEDGHMSSSMLAMDSSCLLAVGAPSSNLRVHDRFGPEKKTLKLSR